MKKNNWIGAIILAVVVFLGAWGASGNIVAAFIGTSFLALFILGLILFFEV